MKKTLAALIALMMAIMSLTAFAEEEVISENVLLSGFVMDVQDEYLLLNTKDGMNVQVNLTEETALEGADIAIGEFVHVTYNGMMTRSLPAQITGIAVSNYKLMGVVSEMNEYGFTLTDMDEVYFVNAAAEQMAGIADGMFVIVWHSGMMTRSIPAQVAAEHIRGQEIVGTVTEMIENGFILTVEGEEIPYTVYPMEDAKFFVQPEPGMQLIVITNGLMTSALDSITVNAAELLPLAAAQELYDIAGTILEINEDDILIETLDGQQIQVNLSDNVLFEGKELLTAGDYIHVTCNGMMTMSLPAQITALTVGCYAHQGVVSDLTEEGFILTTENDLLWVNLAAPVEGLENGRTVLVYSNGTMTMSLPAQIGAEMIVLLSR